MFFGLSLTETNEIVDKKIKIEFESLQDKAFEMIKKRSEDFENKYLYTQNRDNPEGLIKLWKSFVGSLYNGYIYTNCEFDHDLGWREDIEDLIFNQELLKFEEHKKFIDNIKGLF